MTSNQPYLLRAIHEWIIDNDLTPHLLINAEISSVEVPRQSVQNGQIVLNIATHAITNLHMDNEAVTFSARFSGVAQTVYIPIHAILAIYASENGQGMVFPELDSSQLVKDESTPDIIGEENSGESAKNSNDDDSDPPPRSPPFLKVIK